jgi:hypothetical protein
MVLMAQRDKKLVMLRVEVSETLRSRLRAQSVRMNITMGELVEKLADEPITLKQLERESLKDIEE